MSSTERIPTLILGGTGYVAGEVLRLVVGHPAFEIAGVMSDSQPGEPVAKAFPHLAAVLGDLRFLSEDDVRSRLAQHPRSAVLQSFAGHRATAAAEVEPAATRQAWGQSVDHRQPHPCSGGPGDVSRRALQTPAAADP